jgi:hypothetical protein
LTIALFFIDLVDAYRINPNIDKMCRGANMQECEVQIVSDAKGFSIKHNLAVDGAFFRR